MNITNGASKINGTLVKPGETFSLTDALGPLDAAHGFVEAGAIVSGEHTDAWGGGLSQVSTTTYNAAYLAGFEDISTSRTASGSRGTRRVASRRSSRVTLDMRWKNNTPYGALIQAWVANNRVYVRDLGHQVLDRGVDHEPPLERRPADDRLLAVAHVRGVRGRQPRLHGDGDAQDVAERRADQDRVELVALQPAEQDHLRTGARTPPP